ncbi:MAG: hypothetical protein DRJ03_01565 [Chloroflexi bacterium]|nr:MAG: hypothetical protein DRJ03_01565 [Chloroflexota bacterium]
MSQHSKAAIWITTYHDEAAVSAASFRRHNPGIRTYLFTPDFPPSQSWFDANHKQFDEVVRLPEREHPDNWFLDSTRYFSLVLNFIDVEQILYLDSDTYICDNITDLFSMLDAGFDFLGAHAPGRITRPRVRQTVPPAFPEINIGVNAFRNSGCIAALFDLWMNHFLQHAASFGENDQPALRHALYHSPHVRLGILPSEYNCRWGFGGFASYKVKVLHGRPLDGDYERIEREINAKIIMRSWKRGALN